MKKSLLYLLVFIGLPLSAVAQLENTVSDSANNPEITVSVQPNPATNYITIDIDGSENATVQIIDVLGNVIWNATIKVSETIDVTNYRNGIYFVNISANGNNVSRKVIVRH